MPQLDKVTFLSQFFWLCVVFFGLYLLLVKFFLPSFARLVKVRQFLAQAGAADSASSEENQTNQTQSSSNRVYTESIQSSEQAFEKYSSYLSNWASVEYSGTFSKRLAPQFESSLGSISQNNLLTGILYSSVLPPALFYSSATDTKDASGQARNLYSVWMSRKLAQAATQSKKSASKSKTVDSKKAQAAQKASDQSKKSSKKNKSKKGSKA
jgi:hypothetical protein